MCVNFGCLTSIVQAESGGSSPVECAGIIGTEIFLQIIVIKNLPNLLALLYFTIVEIHVTSEYDHIIKLQVLFQGGKQRLHKPTMKTMPTCTNVRTYFAISIVIFLFLSIFDITLSEVLIKNRYCISFSGYICCHVDCSTFNFKLTPHSNFLEACNPLD